jgi:mono/diheme cytochrome c family protein
MLGVPDFTDRNWWKKDTSDERLTNSITHGKKDMPAFGKKLSEQDITALVAYVRGFNKTSH